MTSPLPPAESPLFLGWSDLGNITVTPDDTDRVVGSFSLEQGDTHLWVRMRSLSQPDPWPWSYGILGWKTSQGYELGSVKAFSNTESEVFRLGNGLPPVERTGVITFEPRSFNLAWVKRGNPWTLNFQAQSGVIQSPGLGGAVVSNSFVNSGDGSGLSLVQVTFPGP
jgi:hypothetical protein